MTANDPPESQFCKDCCHCGIGRKDYYACMHPAFVRLSMVTGRLHEKSCEEIRSGNPTCAGYETRPKTRT